MRTVCFYSSLFMGALLLLATPTHAQTILYGTITNKQHQPLYNTYIMLTGSPWGTTTDSAGHYRIDITEYLRSNPKPVVEFQTSGYAYVQYTPPANATGEVLYNLRFTQPRKHTHHKHHKHQ